MAEETKVDGEAILAFATQVQKFSEELKPIQDGIQGVKVQGGNFAHGTWITTEMDGHKENVDLYLTNLGSALDAIGIDLKAAVDTFKRTEDLNNIKATDLKTLVDDVNKFLPTEEALPAPAAEQPATPV
jgi:hypothetical protein